VPCVLRREGRWKRLGELGSEGRWKREDGSKREKRGEESKM